MASVIDFNVNYMIEIVKYKFSCFPESKPVFCFLCPDAVLDTIIMRIFVRFTKCIDFSRNFCNIDNQSYLVFKGGNMAKAMTKSQIADHLAKKTDLTKRATVQVLDELAALAHKEAKNTFTLPGIGKLVLVNRKARIGRNPATGEEIKIPAKKVVKFRVAKACKDSVLGKK